MSYLVLARKWRPKRFAELVGQEHVVRALCNALESGKVHHAFLFSGTRGVGKTTIARIFAKSLNCERGSGAEPCGECAACLDIDAGRFVDLLEIDAASHTGVDHVRELIDNAQYMPSRGRTKVYLIDEVHMLSKQAFNALLKTLEEPPGHVKFLLATTDPDKLPVTVLSRCLQFNLKRLETEQIAAQISRILDAEGLSIEPLALELLADAADGSLRDGLSLLDQAIAYTGGKLDGQRVGDMLGTVDRAQVGSMLRALAAGDGESLLRQVDALAAYAPDFSGMLEALAADLHRVQLEQLVPAAAAERRGRDREEASRLAQALEPELVQLWYQIAVQGRRDLPLAPSPRSGFEMCLLRMLAFRPDPAQGAVELPPDGGRRASAGGAAAVVDAGAGAPRPGPSATRPEPSVTKRAQSATRPEPSATPAADCTEADGAPPLAGPDDWLALVPRLALKGPASVLAAHAAFVGYRHRTLTLSLPAGDDHLRSAKLLAQLSAALATALGEKTGLELVTADDDQAQTLHRHRAELDEQRRSKAEADFLADPLVDHLVRERGATVLTGTIRPSEERR